MADSVLLSNIANPKLPEIMTPAQGVELQSMALHLQNQKLQQAQTLAMIGKQQQIQARLSRPDSVGPDGLPSAATLKDISAIDAGVGLDMMGKVEHYRDQKIASQRAADQDRLVKAQLDEKARAVGDDLAAEVVSRVDREFPKGTSPAILDQAVRKYWGEGIESRRSSGAFASFMQDDLDPAGKSHSWAGLRSAPVTYSMLKGRVQTPKEVAAEQRKSTYEERDVNKPGDMIQKEYRDSPTDPWKPLGAPVHKFAKQTPGAGDTGEQQLTDEALQVGAYEKLMFGKEFPGMGKASANQRIKVRNFSAHIGKELGLTPAEQAMLPFDNKIKLKAADKLTTWGAFIDKSVVQLDKTLDIAIDYAEKLGPGRLRTLNKAILAGKTEFNDPVANQYALQVNAIRGEVARLYTAPTSNAMLPVEAQKKAEEMISSGLNVEAWKGIKAAVLRDAEAARTGIQTTKGALMGSIMNMGKIEGAPLPGPSGTSAPAPKSSPVEQITNDYRNGKMTKKQMEDAFYKYYSENPDAR